MAKIVFYLPGNGTHSFLIGDRFERMYEQKLGIETLGKTGAPIAISHQGIDYELFPFLRELHSQYKNLEIVGAPYSHGLLPLVRFFDTKDTRDYLRWENGFGAKGNVPVTFFSEFYNPVFWAIPTEYFFILKEQTCSYSLDASGINIKEEHLSQIPVEATAVNYQGKIGILIDGFKSFIKAWFSFAAIPSSENMAKLMDEFDAMAADPREYIVVPMDLEQPWVGSVAGEKLWEMFFSELAKRPTSRNVVPLSAILGGCKERAVKIKQPHRVLTKWTVHDIQFKCLMDLNSLVARSLRQRKIFSLAFASDHLSSLNRIAFSTTRKIGQIKAMDLNGEMHSLSQGANEVLQHCCDAAYKVLRFGDRKLSEMLEVVAGDNYFAHRLLKWSEQGEL